MRNDDAPAWLRFLPLGFPSANLLVTTEGERVLFDSGYGSDAQRLLGALGQKRQPVPRRVAWTSSSTPTGTVITSAGTDCCSPSTAPGRGGPR